MTETDEINNNNNNQCLVAAAVAAPATLHRKTNVHYPKFAFSDGSTEVKLRETKQRENQLDLVLLKSKEIFSNKK